MNTRFKDYYSKLYTVKSRASSTDLTHFFDSLSLPTLDASSRFELDSDFMKDELVSGDN